MVWTLEPTISLRNRCVLIVDDILDEGITLSEIARYCREKGASEVLTAVLVEKQLDKAKPITADFVGLRTENLYLFGYGLDYKNHLRNCAGIFACTQVY
jgi:hypoxanthine phosphoribosyltransferase